MRISALMFCLAPCFSMGLGTAQSSSGPTSPPSLPPSVQDRSIRVENALQKQDNAGAMAEYRNMLAADPDNTQALTGMGVLLYGAGRATEAQEALKHALRIDPAAPRAELFLALSRAETGDCALALPVLGQAFERERVGKLHRLVGITFLECSTGNADAAAALRVAGRMKRDYPGDADVLYESAELYTRMWSEAADELITAHPDSYRVHQLAAEVNAAQGNATQAIRQYRTALAANPRLTQMHFRIGQLLLQSGEADADEEAMKEFRAELALNPRSAVSLLALAEMERHHGQLTEASADYTAALAIEPALAEARVGLAQTLLAQHKVEAAQTEARTLLAQHPENSEAHYAMMLIYREQGKLTEAAAEMLAFQRLRDSKEEGFQKKLDALLTGRAAVVSPAPASGFQLK